MTLRVAVSAGHHNSDGGSPLEYSITGELCEAYYRAFKAAGVDVRVITPDGLDPDSDPGDGMFPGGLQDVAQKVVDWANAGWTADLFLECHTQGLGDTSVRGCFAIYPDWGGDLDQTVRGALGRKICQAVSSASGIPIYGNGLMSEKSTGVGISGYRLGIFLRTAPVASKTTRLIVEHGAHSNPQDLAILKTSGMLDKIGEAGAKAIIEYFGGNQNVNVPTQKPSEPAVIFVPETGKSVGNGFKTFWQGLDKLGDNYRLLILGLPVTNEFDMVFSDDAATGKKHTVQLFQRGGLVHEEGNPAPWDNHTLMAGQLMEAYHYAAANGLIAANPQTDLLLAKDKQLGQFAKWLEVLQSTFEGYAGQLFDEGKIRTFDKLLAAARSGKSFDDYQVGK
jgi:hypothetical protein